MTHVRRSLLVIVSLLAILAASCAGPSLSVSEYGMILEDETDAYISEAQTLSLAYQRTVEDKIGILAAEGEGDLLSQATDVTARETVQYLAILEDAMMRYRSTLELLMPPSMLVKAHGVYVKAIASVESSMPATRDAVANAKDLGGIQTAITSSGFNDGQSRLRAACSALEAAVRAEGRGVDLGCSRPSDVVAQP